MVTDTVNSSDVLKKEVNEKSNDNAQIPEPVQSEKPKTNRELALQGIEEICQKYNLKPFHISEAMSNKLKESTDLLKNEANMYQQNLQAMTNKVLYKELLAREVQANKVLDNHAAEMQQYEKNIIDAILGWIKMNGNPEIDAMMSIMERELGLGYDKVSRDLQSRINQKTQQEIGIKLSIIEEDYKQKIKETILEFANSSKKRQRELISMRFSK